MKWAGGKRTLLQALLALVPPDIKTFYEPFLGGGAFFFALAPSRAVLNDANDELIDTYKAVRDAPEAVMVELDRLKSHVQDKQFYYQYRADDPTLLEPAQRAARFIYLNKTCYNGLYRVNRAGQFNVPFGRYAAPPALYNSDNLLRVSQALQRAKLRSEDFEGVLRDAGPGDFVYLDPPYVPLSRTASFTRYTSGDFGPDDQQRLAAVVDDLDARGCRFLLSNSDVPLVHNLYARSHYRKKLLHAPRNINSDASRRQRVAELAVYNYPTPRARRRKDSTRDIAREPALFD